jgi:hypothetical protein
MARNTAGTSGSEDDLKELALRPVSRCVALRSQLQKLADVTAQQRARYAIVAVDAQPPPQGDGARGGPGGSSDGAGGASPSRAAKAPGRTYRAPDGKAGDGARDLVAAARDVGTAADLHEASKARVDAIEHRPRKS